MQSEELAAQEEMCQNMEELQATQEEAARREQEMIGVLNVIDNSVFKVEYDIRGKITSANNKYANFLNVDTEKLIDKSLKQEFELLGDSSTQTDALWSALIGGATQVVKINVLVNGVNHKLEEHYSPVMIQNDKQPSKIIKIAYIIA
ncbi:MAG: hypothetical protein PF517_13705 [Salinivirgaceae bacterium]|jgi:methyl-accepting chemotaxis protein|nr:hypothetical protein [Salinivirgaceae bacterium]